MRLKNARRLYRIIAQGGEEGPCAEQLGAAAETACAMPDSVAEVVLGGCRLRLDDARRTVTLDEPTALAGQPADDTSHLRRSPSVTSLGP